MKVRTTRLRAAAALLSIGAVVAACGSSPTDSKTNDKAASASGGDALSAVYQAVDGLTGQKRYDKLLQMAKDAGGQIGWYHSGDMTTEVAAFEKTTGLKVNDFQATSERVAERVVQENKANQQGSDMVLGGASDLQALEKEGGLAEHLQTPTFDYVVKDYKNDFSVDPLAIMEMPTYNTDKVQVSQLPKTWMDYFQNPPARIGIEITDWEWFETMVRKYLMTKQHMTEQQAIDLITKGLKGAQQVDGHTLVANLLASGQYGYVSNLYAQYVPKLQKAGAPVSFDHLSKDMPPFVTALSMALTKGGPNPAGGLLLLEWMMGPEGQKVIDAQGYVPVSNKFDGDTLLEQYPDAIQMNLYLTDTPADKQAWQKKFDTLLQSIGGTPISK